MHVVGETLDQLPANLEGNGGRGPPPRCRAQVSGTDAARQSCGGACAPAAAPARIDAR